jgi:hypothetical protein
MHVIVIQEQKPEHHTYSFEVERLEIPSILNSLLTAEIATTAYHDHQNYLAVV